MNPSSEQPQQKGSTPPPVNCPKCGSAQIHVDKAGYSGAKGCCGFIACGPIGLLFGTSGANKIKKTCISCNNSWY